MHPYQNSNLSFEERAKDLVSRMTIEEKTSQMLHYAPSIKRLGIPTYNWWGESLHGVARAGVATVFPQAIGLAATFDENFLFDIATVISDEGRAKHHEFIRQGDRGIYKGLTYWSPNINIFRDPRWGRGHETYGEDPYLTGKLGVAFIRGLQGNDEKYLKIAACAKHFAVHSGPEGDRHSFDAVVSKKDLYETYLPAFETCVKEGKVEAIMGAYNAVNGEPCCGSTTLLQDILRDEWEFKGHVVSDCWAICDFHLNHKVTDNAVESAAMAVKAGSDLNCGSTYSSLLVALKEKLITEEEIDQAVIRLFTTRFKLGMFDTEEEVQYAQIPFEVNDRDEHHDLAIEAARRSMVLLKNKENVLPLDLDKVKNIAVIGPNADDAEMLLGNYNGTPSSTCTPLAGIKQYVKNKTKGETRIFYAKGCETLKDKTEALADSGDRIAEAVSVAKRSDIAIVCLGLNSMIEGEEGDASNAEAAGDKVSLKFPGNQTELLEKIIETKTPTILVSFTGSAMDLVYADEHAEAIIQAWYPGAEGGIALADLLFGESDFSGRLPISYVKDIKDLPDFKDYCMAGRTYRYANKELLYSFGYGLTYNNYQYTDLEIENKENDEDDDKDLKVMVKVKNTGNYAGREVIQVYIKHINAESVTPNYQLVDCKVMELNPNEEQVGILNISKKQLCIVDEEGKRQLKSGRIQIFVGGSCPDERSEMLRNQKCLMHEMNI